MDNAVEPVGRLVAAARAARDSGADEDLHAYWGLVLDSVQGERGTGALRGGLELLESADPLERRVGCDLVGRAAEGHEALRGEAATGLVALAGVETADDVLGSLATALGRTQDPRGVPVLVRLSEHGDAELRWDVAVAFGSVSSGLPDGPDVRALIRLTRDEDPEVREWAAFTLGCQLDQDTAAVRAALWGCAADECAEVRAEGVRGLARRHDLRAVPLVAQLLAAQEDDCRMRTLDAAAVLGVPELLPALAAHGGDESDREETDRAAAACDPARRARIEDTAWAVVVELDRLRADLGAALSSPRHESVHNLALTLRRIGTETYDAAALLARAGGDPARAAELVVADLS